MVPHLFSVCAIAQLTHTTRLHIVPTRQGSSSCWARSEGPCTATPAGLGLTSPAPTLSTKSPRPRLTPCQRSDRAVRTRLICWPVCSDYYLGLAWAVHQYWTQPRACFDVAQLSTQLTLMRGMSPPSYCSVSAFSARHRQLRQGVSRHL